MRNLDLHPQFVFRVVSPFHRFHCTPFNDSVIPYPPPNTFRHMTQPSISYQTRFCVYHLNSLALKTRSNIRQSDAHHCGHMGNVFILWILATWLDDRTWVYQNSGTSMDFLDGNGCVVSTIASQDSMTAYHHKGTLLCGVPTRVPVEIRELVWI